MIGGCGRSGASPSPGPEVDVESRDLADTTELKQERVHLRTEVRNLQKQQAKTGKKLQALASEERQLAHEVARCVFAKRERT